MRDWMFSSVMSGCPAGKEGPECPGVLLEEIVNGDGSKANIQVGGQCAGIVDRTGGGILAGHADRSHILFAQRVDSDGSDQRRIHPSAQADQHLGKPAFADIVPGA